MLLLRSGMYTPTGYSFSEVVPKSQHLEMKLTVPTAHVFVQSRLANYTHRCLFRDLKTQRAAHFQVSAITRWTSPASSTAIFYSSSRRALRRRLHRSNSITPERGYSAQQWAFFDFSRNHGIQVMQNNLRQRVTQGQQLVVQRSLDALFESNPTPIYAGIFLHIKQNSSNIVHFYSSNQWPHIS